MTVEQATEELTRRLQIALWMAVNALESEAEMWSAVASVDGSDTATQRSSDIQDEARLLREVLWAHDLQ